VVALKIDLGNKREALVIFFIFAVIFLLRLYGLGRHDLWYDEIFTVNYARQPWFNVNAPLYWILLHFWTKLFGFSELSLRLPSAIFSFGSVIFVYLIAKRLFGKRAGIISSLLMGLSPFHLWYAQEARDYSMVLFLGTFSSYLLLRALKRGHRINWLAFIPVSIMGLYASYFYIPLFLAHFLYVALSKNRRTGFNESFSFSAIMLGFSFFLPRFILKFNTIRQGFWVPEPDAGSLLITLENFLLGYNGTPTLYIACSVIAGVLLLSLCWRMRRPGLGKQVVFCVTLSIVPIFLIFAFSRALFPIYLDRGLIIFSPYIYILLAAGLVFLHRRLSLFIGPAFLALLVAGSYAYFADIMVSPIEHHMGTYTKKPIRPVTEFLMNNIGPGDIAGYTNECVIPSVSYYSQYKLPLFYFFFDPRIPDSSWKIFHREDKYHVPFYNIGKLKFDRLWVISSDWSRSGDLDNVSMVVKRWLDANLAMESEREIDGVKIYAYTKR